MPPPWAKTTDVLQRLCIAQNKWKPSTHSEASLCHHEIHGYDLPGRTHATHTPTLSVVSLWIGLRVYLLHESVSRVCDCLWSYAHILCECECECECECACVCVQVPAVVFPGGQPEPALAAVALCSQVVGVPPRHLQGAIINTHTHTHTHTHILLTCTGEHGQEDQCNFPLP